MLVARFEAGQDFDGEPLEWLPREEALKLHAEGYGSFHRDANVFENSGRPQNIGGVDLAEPFMNRVAVHQQFGAKKKLVYLNPARWRTVVLVPKESLQ